MPDMPQNPSNDETPQARQADPVAPRGTRRLRPGTREWAAQILHEVGTPSRPTIHPALVPGVGVDESKGDFRLQWSVAAVAGCIALGFILWGLIDLPSLQAASHDIFGWMTSNLGWWFKLLTVAVFVFMLWVGFGRYRNIPLGRDGEKPEFSRSSWVAMLFSAGIGIGLLFFGPYEPLTYFLNVPPAFYRVEPGTYEAMQTALAQTIFHWGPMAWTYYALIGGAIAYVSYRRGRVPLISSLLDPLWSGRTKGILGPIVDAFAIVVTLFGTAVSLGIGALQITRGVEIVGGLGHLGNAVVIGIIAVLTACFIASAVSGVKRGIRALSNINMVVAGLLGLFVFIAGPTALLLALIPSATATFLGDTFRLVAQSAVSAPNAADFMSAWTTYYWAWWVSWTPFVGLFIARVSRGRTLRQFVSMVVIVPSLVCLVWFTIFGGTAMKMQMDGKDIANAPSSQDMLFTMLGDLPWPQVTAVVAMVSILIFFVTSADSASVVMSSLSQRGNPNPRKIVTAIWGLALAGIAIVMLLIGGQVALNGLQGLIITTALPFSFVLIAVMVAWAKDLARDPMTLRRTYAIEAIAKGLRAGIEKHGDDFVFASQHSDPQMGAGAWLDTTDPSLTDWYTDSLTEAADAAETVDENRPQPDRGE